MDQTKLNLTEDILLELQPWLISVCETGSCTLPWIDSPHDRDVVFYVGHNHTSPEVQLFRSLVKSFKPSGECWILEIIPDRKYLYAYQYHFLKPIFGTEVPKWDIFEPLMMNRTKRFLVHWATTHHSQESKLWYHVLTQIYLFNNGDYFLTPEQANNVRLCHDRQMSNEIYEYIMTELNKYAVELGLELIRFTSTKEDNQ